MRWSCGSTSIDWPESRLARLLAAPDQQARDPICIGFQEKHLVPLFRCCAWNILERLLSLQFDQKCFARRHPVQGKPGSDKCHRTSVAGNVYLVGYILHSRHDFTLLIF